MALTIEYPELSKESIMIICLLLTVTSAMCTEENVGVLICINLYVVLMESLIETTVFEI